jgi:hypothetical protein
MKKTGKVIVSQANSRFQEIVSMRGKSGSWPRPALP